MKISGQINHVQYVLECRLSNGGITLNVVGQDHGITMMKYNNINNNNNNEPKWRYYLYRFVIHVLALATINLTAKFEVYIPTHYKRIKDDTKCRKWGGLGSLGSFKVTGNSNILQSV